MLRTVTTVTWLEMPQMFFLHFVMVIYGNGELYSKLLYNAINLHCIQRLKVYYSMAQEKKGSKALKYPDCTAPFHPVGLMTKGCYYRPISGM